jgi:hypothetical protein
MTRDVGAARQDPEDARPRPEALLELHQPPPPPRLVTSPDAREALARARRPRTDRLGRVLVGPPLQPAWEAAALQAEQAPRGRQWPPPLTNEGRVTVGRRTAPGMAGSVWGTDDRRQGQRRAGTRAAGLDAGLGLVGIAERGPPAWAAEGSRWAARWGAGDEAQAVLADRGVA